MGHLRKTLRPGIGLRLLFLPVLSAANPTWAQTAGLAQALCAGESPAGAAAERGAGDSQDQERSKPERSAAPAPRPSRRLGVRRVSDRPDYARSADEVLRDGADWSWLELGIEQRSRFELRDDFYLEDGTSESRFLLRTRAYLGVREVFDPLRFAFEFSDSRRFGSDFSENTADIDENELLQAFGELYFADGLGAGEALSLRAGRMSFDLVDRKLFSRNGFRNTTNAFDGFRLRFGDERSPWEVDAFAFQPVERRLRRFDHGDDERWLYGVTAYWRGWSPHIVLEPYYFILDEDRKGDARADRELHTVGLHGFGLIGKTMLDYDFNVAGQFGKSGHDDHCAFATHVELGYTFAHRWQPRVAAIFNYAGGDDDPDDGRSGRFDPLFGSSHGAYGHSDLFAWENMLNPALSLALKPGDRLTFRGFYRVFWLDSKRDSWARTGLVDPAGRSGSFVGQEIDLQMTWKLNEHAQLDIGYAYFMPGDFVRNASEDADDSDFLYVELTLAL